MAQHYEKESKRLIKLLQRLEQWFRGERLYEEILIEPFRWNYSSGHFEHLTMQNKWSKVINARKPGVMIEFSGKIRTFHERARKAKVEQAVRMAFAADSLEEYLTELGKDADLSGPLDWNQ